MERVSVLLQVSAGHACVMWTLSPCSRRGLAMCRRATLTEMGIYRTEISIIFVQLFVYCVNGTKIPQNL